jgi:hypothetical protein
MIIEDGIKTMTVEGEATLDKKFYTTVAELKAWSAPHDREIITEEAKQSILKSAADLNNTNGMTIIFD